MQIGIIGLGRMGGNISRRLMRAGHGAVVFDSNAKARAALAQEGATQRPRSPSSSRRSKSRRAVWVMLPAGKITEETVRELGGLLEAGDIDHRRRQHLLQGRHPPRQGAARESASITSIAAPPAASGDSNAAIA